MAIDLREDPRVDLAMAQQIGGAIGNIFRGHKKRKAEQAIGSIMADPNMNAEQREKAMLNVPGYADTEAYKETQVEVQRKRAQQDRIDQQVKLRDTLHQREVQRRADIGFTPEDELAREKYRAGIRPKEEAGVGGVGGTPSSIAYARKQLLDQGYSEDQVNRVIAKAYPDFAAAIAEPEGAAVPRETTAPAPGGVPGQQPAGGPVVIPESGEITEVAGVEEVTEPVDPAKAEFHKQKEAVLAGKGSPAEKRAMVESLFTDYQGVSGPPEQVTAPIEEPVGEPITKEQYQAKRAEIKARKLPPKQRRAEEKKAYMAYKAGKEAPATDDSIRPDGTKKGTGYLGVLKEAGGNDVTEYSISTDLVIPGSKTNDFPTMVPTLTKAEIDTMLNDVIPNRGEIPESVVRKAEAHARKRISEGKSVWATGKEAPQAAQTIEQGFKLDKAALSKIKILRDRGVSDKIIQQALSESGYQPVSTPANLESQVDLSRDIPSRPGTRLPFDEGYEGEQRPGTRLPFDEGYEGEQRPGVRLPFDEGYEGQPAGEAGPAGSQTSGSKAPRIVPENVDTGIFKVRGDLKKTAMTGLQLERVGGAAGTLEGVNEAAEKIFKAINDVTNISSAIGTGWSLDRIKDVLYEQVYQEQVSSRREAENDRRRISRTFGR